LAMNAGAFGSETWNIVKSVTTIDRKGEVRTHDKNDFSVGYRTVKKPLDEWFISAILVLKPDKKHEGQNTLRELLNQRNETQPVGEASCGSVFRNPENTEPAAKLIESCGLKGKCIGEACISEKHANFIINTGKAKASDIERLIKHVQDSVYKKYQVSLIPEVQMIGEKIER